MKRPPCPTCDKPMAAILYGLVNEREMLPGRPLARDVESGRVVLAGCSMPVDAPEWACTTCDGGGPMCDVSNSTPPLERVEKLEAHTLSPGDLLAPRGPPGTR